MWESDLTDGFHPPVQWAELLVFIPKIFEIILDAQALADAGEQTEIPLITLQALTECRQVEYDDRRVTLAQPRRGADHE